MMLERVSCVSWGTEGNASIPRVPGVAESNTAPPWKYPRKERVVQCLTESSKHLKSQAVEMIFQDEVFQEPTITHYFKQLLS